MLRKRLGRRIDKRQTSVMRALSSCWCKKEVYVKEKVVISLGE